MADGSPMKGGVWMATDRLFFVTFDMFDGAHWRHYGVYCSRVEYDRADAAMLTVTLTNGKVRYYNPVREVSVEVRSERRKALASM